MHGRTWKRVALGLGLGLALTAVPTTAVSATAGADTAAHAWRLVGPNGSGGSLAFTAADPARLYVLPDIGQSVYRTDDHGSTWTPQAGLGLPGVIGNRIAADPRNADVVYVAATTAGGGAGYVLRSDDAARTFHPVEQSTGGIADVVVSPSGQDVFAAGDSGVFASTDRGRHWQPLPGAPTGVLRIGLSGGDLFLGAGNGLYVIDDAIGEPRTARKLPLPGRMSIGSLAIGGRAMVASNMLSGAVLSLDHGRSWQRLAGPWGPTDALAFTGITATGQIEVQAITGSSDGTTAPRNLWVSGDLGRTWSGRPAATADVDVYSNIGSFPDRPYEQVVAASAGVYTTRDSTTFRRIGVPATNVLALLSSGSTLLAGTGIGTFRSSAPLAANPPRGYQDWGWTGQGPPTIGNSIDALATSPGGNAPVLRVRNTYCGGDCFALERSSDGGTTWQTLTSVDGHAKSLAVDPANPSRVYVSAYLMGTGGVYVSDDGGTTLALHHANGLGGVVAVAVDPRADGALWIGDATGLYHSTDEGTTVTKLFDGEVDRVAVDPADPRHVVAAGNGLVKTSRDGGTTFSDAVGLPGPQFVDVTFAPDGTLFVASQNHFTPGQGVFRSTDGGVHWSGLATEPVDRDVHAVLVSPDGRWLFAGTGGGVYRLRLR